MNELGMGDGDGALGEGGLYVGDGYVFECVEVAF